MEESDDESPSERTFDQLMALYITPEVERRQTAGTLPERFDLRAAQVLLYPDGRAPLVRLNAEVRAVAKMALRDGITKKKGEAVYEHELQELSAIELTDDDDPDCAHVTMIRVDGQWALAFDFRRNKALAARHVATSRQFHRSATDAADRADWAALVDSLFSAAELAARAWLLTLADPKFTKKSSHQAIQMRYQRLGSLNVDPRFIAALNKLSGWRDRLRYVRGSVPIDPGQANELLGVISEMIDDAARSAA